MVSKGTADLAPQGAEEKRVAVVQAIAELRHPHLVAMRERGDGGYEADLGASRSLAELQAARGPLPLRAALRILLDALSGLSALHRARVGAKNLDFVHGEVTPDNVIVGPDGVARLVPLVEAHWSPTPRDTPRARGYTAPEKLLGDDFDQRADVFSVGVLLWEAMMGQSLFGDMAVNDIVTQLVGGKVRPPIVTEGADADWSADLADVVMRALAVDPADRWAHVGIMGADIETISEGKMAKSSELISLVTGREVSRDSMSDEVTRPLASISSLTPLTNSIPSPDEPTAPDSPGALVARRSDSAEPVEAPPRPPFFSQAPMPERHRRRIVAGALSFSFLVLAVAGIKALAGRPDAPPPTTVLAPAAAPIAETASLAEPASFAETAPEPQAGPVAPPPEPPAAPTAAAPKPAPAKAAAAPPAPDPKASRAPAKTSASSSKPKEDPFGLLKPVRSKKQKDDPFGL
jgi:serine/threonine-protein kinase